MEKQESICSFSIIEVGNFSIGTESITAIKEVEYDEGKNRWYFTIFSSNNTFKSEYYNEVEAIEEKNRCYFQWNRYKTSKQILPDFEIKKY